MKVDLGDSGIVKCATCPNIRNMVCINAQTRIALSTPFQIIVHLTTLHMLMSLANFDFGSFLGLFGKFPCSLARVLCALT